MRRIAGVTAAMVLLVLFPAVSAPAQSSWEQPALVRSVGGTGRAAMFAWGIASNPVSGEIVVGDYLNYQIRRFDSDGEHLGDFFRSNNRGQPYSLAVDPANGDIWVPEIADGSVTRYLARYSKDGVYLGEIRLQSSVQYYAWIAIDAQRNLWVADSHYWDTATQPPQIHKYRLDGTRLATWNITLPDGRPLPRMYGIDVDAVGNVYASDTINKVVHKFSPTGTRLGEFGAGYFSGDVRDVAIDDANGFIYVTDASDNQVEKFAMNGAHIATLGGTGSGLGQLSAPRQLAVDPDGALWVAEYGNHRIQKFDVDGTPLGISPWPARDAPAGQLGQPRDVDVDAATGDVLVADSWNQRVQRFAADGSFIGTWGARGGSPPYGMNYPRGIAVNPANGEIWVSNERGHHIKVYDSAMNYLRTLGDTQVDSTANGYFRWPQDVEFLGERAYVADRVGDRVKVLNAATGAELVTIARNNRGLAVDPASGRIYVLDDGTRRVYAYSPAGAQLFFFGSQGAGDGQFQTPWDAVIVDDVLYVADSQASRIQAFSLDGVFLGKWGGWGAGPYQFKNPSGIAADAEGRLYVADAGNDRIQVFDTRTPKPLYEWPRPTVAVSSPVTGQIMPIAPVRISGTAADNVAVASVQISVRDAGSGLWWNPDSSTWQADQAWAIAGYTGAAPTSSVSFAWTFVGVTPGRSYQAHVRALDSSNNTSAQTAVVGFSILADDSDDEDPDGLLAVPTAGQAFPSDQPIVLNGTATDNVSVTHVDVAIRRASTGLWLRPDGTWGSAFTWGLEADLELPGAAATAWSLAWAAPVAGDYGVTIRARDAAGNIDQDRPFVNFAVVDPPAPDTVPPTGAVTTPTPQQTFPSTAPAPLRGTAEDDLAVGRVFVAVRDNATLQWRQPNGSWGAFAWLDAELVLPGAALSEWRLDVVLAAGAYGMQLRVDDAAGNTAAHRPWVPFSVVAPASDTQPPTVQVSEPRPNQTVGLGPITVTGAASDNVSVAAVYVSIRDNSTNLWWRANGTWGAFQLLPATLTAPGADATQWTYEWQPPAAGSYGLQVRVDDAAGNINPTKPWVGFTVAG